MTALAALLFGCSGEAGETSDVRTRADAITLDTAAQFTIEMPTQVATSSSAVFGKSWVKWGDRATVVAEGAEGVITTGAFGDVEVGHDSTPRSVVSAGDATVRDRAKVDGDLIVQGNGQVAQSAQIFGTQALGVNVPTAEAFVMPVYTPDDIAGPVHIEPDQDVTLAPADYGTVAVKSRSTIHLSSGVYDFDTLQVAEPQSKLSIDDSAGGVIIYVRNQLTYRGDVSVVSESGGFPNLLVVYLGQSDLWLEAPFQGHLFAPNAVVRLRPMQGAFTGSVWANGVEVHPGTLFIHQPFSLNDFFFPDLGLDTDPYVFGQSRPVVPGPDDYLIPSKVSSALWTELDGGVPDDLDCTPELTYEVDPDDPSRLLSIRYLTEEEKAAEDCVSEYFECADNGDGTFGSPTRPTEAELNAEPPEGSTCPAVVPKEPCGVDDAVLDLPESQRPTCTVAADCDEGEVCADFCPKEDCQPDEFVSYCTTELESCGGLPDDDQCETRSVCPEDDYTGPDYDDEDVQDAKTAVDPDDAVPDEEPELAPYVRPGCSDAAPDAGGSNDDPSPTPEGSGNDKWGIDFTPSLDYAFSTPSTASPVTTDLNVRGAAGFNVTAKVWGKAVPILNASVSAELSPASLALNRTTKFFGQDIDLTGNVDGQIKEEIDDGLSGDIEDGLVLYDQRLSDAQLAFSQLFWIRDILQSNDIFGDPVKGEEFCALSRDVLGGTLSNLVCSASPLTDCVPALVCEGVDCPTEPNDEDEDECSPTETEEEAAVRFEAELEAAVQAWKDEYEAEIAQLGDPQDALNAAIAPALDEIPRAGNGLAEFVPMVSARHRFSAFSYSFTFAVGPVPVTMEIALGGSFGVDAGVELSADFQDELYARAGAYVTPGLDIQALAFAGINLGFAQVGVGGELTLIDIEIPVKAGAGIQGQRQEDTRPLQLELGEGVVQDVSDVANDLIPLLTTKWSGGFYYGAGMRVQVLSGNVNLQARIRLLFYKKNFKKVLASWNGLTFEKSFVGSIAAVSDLELPEEVQQIVGDLVAEGNDLEDLKGMVPLSDQGYTGHYGNQTPLLSLAGAQQLEWPPAFAAVGEVTPIPTKEALCFFDPGGVR